MRSLFISLEALADTKVKVNSAHPAWAKRTWASKCADGACRRRKDERATGDNVAG